MKIIISALVIWFYLKHVMCSDCYWNSECKYKYFSSKTPYDLVRGDIRESIVKQKDCEIVSIWGIARHGQRYPGRLYQNFMKECIGIKDDVAYSYEIGNTTLCAQDVENLRKWQISQEWYDKPSQLTKDGYWEAEGIGRRVKQAFSNFLENLEEDDYLFRSAPGAWMEDSAKGFVEGFSSKKQLTIQPPKTKFDILSQYETCNKYILDVKNSSATRVEVDKYMIGPEYLALRDRLQRRLGLNYTLSDTNIAALYDLCRYLSTGLNSQVNPWCAIFSTEDLKIMEYIFDMKIYYRNGYGTPINELFGQVTIADLYKSFLEAKNGHGKKITTYFTHASMMSMVYTALKLYKDDGILTGPKLNPNRKWRTSILAVHSSNIIAVLNKCKGPNNYNVVFYASEAPLTTICNQGICSWSEFEDMLSPFLKTNVDFCHK